MSKLEQFSIPSIIYYYDPIERSRVEARERLEQYVRQKGYDPATVQNVGPTPDGYGYLVLAESLPCYDVADVDY